MAYVHLHLRISKPYKYTSHHCDKMRISEVFSVIYDHESDYYQRERKFTLIRKILTERLADKTNFGSVITDHDNIVRRVAGLSIMTQTEVEDALIDIYNYPEIRDEYEPLVKDYIYELVQDDNDNDDDETEEEEEEFDTSEEEFEENCCVQPSFNVSEDLRQMNTKVTMALIFSSVTFMLSVVNTLALFVRR